jgi:hypothetical protein
MDDAQVQAQLQQKIDMLEGQVQNILQYIGNPQGELFASALQVQRLEQNVFQHQTSLQTVNEQLKTFQEGVSQYMDSLYTQISQQRGSRGLDIQLLVKFTSGSISEAIGKLHSLIEREIQSSIPFKKLQDLERQLLMKQQSSGMRQSSDDVRIVKLEGRLGLLEQGQSKQPQVQQAPPTEGLKEVKEHIQHLETQLLKELEKAYKTVGGKQNDGPLPQLQSKIMILEKEFQAFRGNNTQALLETMIATSVRTAKTALEQQLASKVSIEELISTKKSMERVEDFARGVQTGFTKMKAEYDVITQEIQTALTTERLDEFRTMRSDMVKLGEEIKGELASSRLLTKEFAKINKTLTDLREENKEQVGVWLREQLAETQSNLKVYNDQKMNLIRYQLANEVEKIVKDDFEKFFSNKSIGLIHSHIENELPEKIKGQVTEYVRDFELATKSDMYKLQKDISRNVDGIRENKESHNSLRQKISDQITLFIKQFETIGKTQLQGQSEVGKLQRQVQSLTLQVKELNVSIVSEQKRFENRILDILAQQQSQRVQDHVEYMRPPPPKVLPPPQTNKKSELAYVSLTKCFYTALLGKESDVDTLADFEKIPGWDYICFTNLDFPKHRGWKFIKVEAGMNPVLVAKHYKWMSHLYLGDYDVVVWMDAYMSPNPVFSELFKHWIVSMREQNIAIAHRPHDTRKCIWEECSAVIEHKRAKPEDVAKVIRNLEAIRMPKEYGLYDTNIVIRFHKLTILQHISEEIFTSLQDCTRDQLAVTMIYYKNSFSSIHLQNLIRAFNKTGEHRRINAY